MTKSFKLTKFACYSAYFTMSSVFCLPPLLFVTFHETYDVSWTLLGTLVLVNFFTQLGVDLLFTFGKDALNIAKGALENGLTASQIVSVESLDTPEAMADAICNLTVAGDVLLFKASRGVKLERVIALLK